MRALQRPGPYLALRVFAGYPHLGDNRQRIYYCCQCPEWTDYMSNVKIYCVIFLLAGTILSSSCSGDSNPPKVDSESDSTAISATETVTLVSETNKGVEAVATATPSPTASPSPEPTYRHLNGDRIPATTDAGTDTCDARFLETAFCIELLPYTGITAEHLQKTVDGLQAIVGRYPVSKSELKVDWPNFGPNGGYQSYLGVVMWHVEQSDNNRVITDLCRFQMVTADYNAKCSAESTELMDKRATGGATTSPGDMKHNGYLIIASNALMDEPISPAPSPTDLYFKDPRKVMAHEYFHAYQLSHAVRMSGGTDGAGFDKDGDPLDGVTNAGPMWLIEGTAEYAAVRVSSLEGWMDWDAQLMVRMLIALQFLADYPNLSIEDNVTPAQHANNFALSPAVGQVLTYELAVWAAAYAISISSHDAVMVNYWDDLEQYGYEQSFEKNIGMSFDEFYQSFNEFRQKTIDEQMTVVSGQINN